MIEDIILKKKKCSECGNIQDKLNSAVFRCEECDYQCVNGSNYWVLKEDYRSSKKVEELIEEFDLEEVDDFSAGLTKIKKAIENYKSEDSSF